MIAPLDESLEGKILAVPQKDEGPQYTKKGTLRKRRPKTKNQYFTADTEEELEAMHTLSDNQLLLDKVPEGKDGGITWYCEFQDQKRVFDTIAAARHWFLHEVEDQ